MHLSSLHRIKAATSYHAAVTPLCATLRTYSSDRTLRTGHNTCAVGERRELTQNRPEPQPQRRAMIENEPSGSSSTLSCCIANIETGTRTIDKLKSIPLPGRRETENETGSRTVKYVQSLPFPKPKPKDPENRRWEAEIRKAVQYLMHLYSQPAEDTGITIKFPDRLDPISIFFSVEPASIAVSAYIKRLMQYTKCSDSAFIYALIFVRRVEEADPRLSINAFTLHRLFATCIMIAAKVVDDAWYSNDYYKRVGGIATLKEMNRLELEVLRLLKFSTYVPLEEFKELVDFGVKASDGTSILCSRLRLARM